MAYSDFTIAELTQRFGLAVERVGNLFGNVPEVELPAGLEATLARYLPLGLILSTEKARSELIVGPILFDLKLRYADRLSVFSGIEFNVDPAAGLKGRCDFILARSPQQLELWAPVCIIVEAKNENIIAGIPQCLAAMVAAQRFNQIYGTPLGPIHGAVTSAFSWRFMTLDGLRAFVDETEYPIQSPKRIFGILSHMALGPEPNLAAPAAA